MKAQLQNRRDEMGTAHEAFKAFNNSLPEDEDKRTPEQREKISKMEVDMDRLELSIKNLSERVAFDERAKDREARFNEPEQDPYRQSDFSGALGTEAKNNDAKKMEIFNRYLREGEKGITSQEVAEYTKLFQASMVAGQDPSGGYLVMPEKMASGILQAADNEVFIRQMATVHTLDAAASLGVVNLADDIDDYAWTAEIGSATEDTGTTYGKRSMTPHAFRKLVKISRTLVRQSNHPVVNQVMARLGYKVGITQEKHYLTGDGVNKPLGLFVSSDSGIPAARDKTLASATAITADELMDVQGMVKASYQGNCNWLFNQVQITYLRKLKTTDLQYLWVPGLQAGQSTTILGRPVVISEYVPKVQTAGLYVGMYGDFSYYWIVDALNMKLQVLNELYARTNQIGYIAEYEGDGQPVMGEAFARIKMAAS